MIKQMDSPPVFSDNTEYSAGLVRRILSRLIGSQVGMFGVTDFAVSLDGSTVTVSPGRVAIPSPATETGVYFVEATASTVLTLDPADATRDRIDRLVAYVVSPATASETGRWFLEIRKGDPAATPQAPVIPAAYVVQDFVIPAQSKGIQPSATERRYSSGQQYISGPSLYGSERPPFNRPGQVWTDSVNREAWIYNGATWQRIGPGVQIVGSTAEVTAPYVNQIVLRATDRVLLRWSGTDWLLVADMSGTTPGGDWSITANQSTSASPKVITFPNVITSPQGISLDSNGVFTISRPGWWDFTLNLRYTFASTDKYAMIGASSSNLWAKDSTSGSTLNVNAKASKKLPAGATFSCYSYSQDAAGITRESTNDQISGFTAVWRGP
ncbi:hypothetical protein [Amycolatopsis sp. lyj-23]|uniref:hypothetical protein n=1 Tax=Amycolatopsis sp. lyj-23 TaxID=2789283 RepID=UPI00397BFFFA